ncbi:MAG: NAD(P)-dependent oxidoreductase, partial [Acidobacteriaceae bacterium]
MVRIGLQEAIPQDLLRDFPTKNVEIVRLPNQLDHEIDIEIWIPPLFAWQATPMYKHLHGVKFVQVLLAGVDWITPWLPKDIVLCDGQGVHNRPVAEWIIGAILGRLKRFPEFRDRQREQVWDGQAKPENSGGKQDSGQLGADNYWNGQLLPYRVLGDELEGKKVLIVGYGGIGAELDRMLQPFDVDVVRVARTAREGVSAMGDLEKLLPAADVVVLLVPLTAETRGLMSAKTLALMKPGALLVNAARGPVVDTNALLAELDAGRIHAVLDVTDPEPLPQGHPLWTAPNCFITPHVGGSVV